MALKWLGGSKPDHPLADEKGARELLLALSKSDAPQAIEDIRHWIESVMATEGFKPERRAELLLQLDEAAQAHQRKLTRDYLSNPKLSKFQEAQLRRACLPCGRTLPMPVLRALSNSVPTRARQIA